MFRSFTSRNKKNLDDCSKDNSAEVAEKLIRKYKNHFRGGIQYLPNEQNAGVFRQWYKGVSLAKGDLIWIAEADDKCRETMQSKLVHAFRDPLVKIAYAQSALIDGDGEIYSETFPQHTLHVSKYKWTQDYIWDARTETETDLAIKNTIPNASGALIRKTAFSQIPEDLFSYKVIGDWFAYLRMIQDGKVAFCTEPLNLYRRHPGSVVAKNPDRLLEELKTLYAVICEKFEGSNYTRSQMLREFNETRLLLKSSIKMTKPAADQFREDKPVEYWILPEDVDWNGFKAEISKSNAAYLFIMLSGNNTEFPSNAAETFNGSVHVFWKNEVKNKEFLTAVRETQFERYFLFWSRRMHLHLKSFETSSNHISLYQRCRCCPAEWGCFLLRLGYRTFCRCSSAENRADFRINQVQYAV